MFGAGDIETLKFVRKAQDLGFSLNEIRELLILRTDHVPACSHVKELLDQKLTAVEQKITELWSLEISLKRAIRKCKRELKTATPVHQNCCPVLEEITRAARREGQNEKGPADEVAQARNPHRSQYVRVRAKSTKSCSLTVPALSYMAGFEVITYGRV